jgi:hypothetical protein
MRERVAAAEHQNLKCRRLAQPNLPRADHRKRNPFHSLYLRSRIWSIISHVIGYAVKVDDFQWVKVPPRDGSLQREAIGAAMEVTKSLKYSV